MAIVQSPEHEEIPRFAFLRNSCTLVSSLVHPLGHSCGNLPYSSIAGGIPSGSWDLSSIPRSIPYISHLSVTYKSPIIRPKSRFENLPWVDTAGAATMRSVALPTEWQQKSAVKSTVKSCETCTFFRIQTVNAIWHLGSKCFKTSSSESLLRFFNCCHPREHEENR